jgi:hypothetical protein
MIIERNVPMPSRSPTGTPGTYEFDQLDVGDCLWINVPTKYHRKPSIWIGCNRFRNAAYQYGKRTCRRFSTRIVGTRIGCWRVS